LLIIELQKDQIPYWVSVPIGEMNTEVTQGLTALLGHHLVILAQGSRAKLYVVDLRDNSVQEENNSFQSVFQEYENNSFTTYGNNQIIMFGGEKNKVATQRMIWITVESFNRKIIIWIEVLIISLSSSEYQIRRD